MEPSDTRGITLAVDIGGTFTDAVLEAGGERHAAKVLTTSPDPDRGFLESAHQVLKRASLAASDVGLIIHGTTLATNAIIERKGARLALICTEGMRDSLEMAYEHRFEQSDLFMERPAPLVPRHLRLPVRERLAADGSVLIPLDEASVERLAPVLADAGVESVAVGLIHSYANPAHERRVAEILGRHLPDVPISLSSDVSPEIREYDRLSTTTANAYVRPLMAGFLSRLEVSLAQQGFRCPVLLMMSSGGMTTLEVARRFPVRLVESGPAGGAILAKTIAAECGLRQVVSFDMGGTTAKICFLDDYQPQMSRSFEVARHYRFLKGSGLPLRIPVIDMVEIGAGGGSIAAVDQLRRLTVGPESAGSTPGRPAMAAGAGGPRSPTPTWSWGGSTPTDSPEGTWLSRRRPPPPLWWSTSGTPSGFAARRRGHGGERGRRDRRREHGQCRPRPRHRVRQGAGVAHADRLRWRGAAARLPRGGEAGHRPHRDPRGRRRGLGHRVPARRDRVRSGPHALHGPPSLRPGGRQRPLRGNARGDRGRGPARRRRFRPHRGSNGLDALSRAGPRSGGLASHPGLRAC